MSWQRHPGSHSTLFLPFSVSFSLALARRIPPQVLTPPTAPPPASALATPWRRPRRSSRRTRRSRLTPKRLPASRSWPLERPKPTALTYAAFYCLATRPTKPYVCLSRRRTGWRCRPLGHITPEPEDIAFQLLEVNSGTVPACLFRPQQDHAV